MIALYIALALLAAYTLGSLPVGYSIVRLAKGRYRTVGSGHTGGTNVLRTAGSVPAALTVLGDFIKGYGAVLLARTLCPTVPAVWALAGLAAVAGHNWSLFLGLRGGVGTMTTLGAATALLPLAVIGAVIPTVLVIVAWRYTSLGSLTLAATLPLIGLVGVVRGLWPPSHLILCLGTSLMAVWALRANIRRLCRGTERRLGQRLRSEPADASHGCP